ncbi:MAG TPA: TetR family transcriptional regulator [Intrasporangiaceae bacterium]|nr:TetR family transcriptional regulator [Intrasporangiaceae bacterium]
MTDPQPEPLGRRELNKARTREAVVTALRDLLAEQPVHKVTVDQVADAAGISRRTFFNYYAGIPAVVSEVIGTHAAHVAGVIGDFSPSASPLQRLRELVATVGIPTDLIEWLALLNLHGFEDDEGAAAFIRTVWAEKGAWLEETLIDRLPDGVDGTYVATLATTIMNCFAAAERAWVTRRRPGAPVDARAIADFHDELDRALSYAQSGWAAPVTGSTAAKGR